MTDHEIIDILNRFENVMNFIKSKEDIEAIADKVNKIYYFVTRFESLEKLIDHLNKIEKYIYVGKDMFTVEETADFLGVSTSFVYRLTSGKQISVYRPSGKLLYISKEELIKWMMQNEEISNERLQELGSKKVDEMKHKRKRKEERL